MCNPASRICQVPVNILGGLENCPVLPDRKIKIKEAKMKNAAVINEGHEADDGDDEHQQIEHQVHRA